MTQSTDAPAVTSKQLEAILKSLGYVLNFENERFIQFKREAGASKRRPGGGDWRDVETLRKPTFALVGSSDSLLAYEWADVVAMVRDVTGESHAEAERRIKPFIK